VNKAALQRVIDLDRKIAIVDKTEDPTVRESRAEPDE
jgi:hypothetical protein